jgi:hypothetical protein
MEILLCIIVAVVVWLFVWPNKHNTETFPHPDECFDCKKSDCGGCEVNKEKEVI